MPAFRDWIAGRTAVTVADADELYVRDDSLNDSKRITWSSLKAALFSSPTFTGTVTSTGNVTIESSQPKLFLRSNTAGANKGHFQIQANSSNQWIFSEVDDTGAIVQQFFQVRPDDNELRLGPAGSGTIVTVPDATADGQALAYDQANWQLGTGVIKDRLAVESPGTPGRTFPPGVKLLDTDSAYYGEVAVNGNEFTIRPRVVAGDAQVAKSILIDLTTGSVNMTDAPSVTIPAASAATHAAQVSAIDATTGRLAIGGVEMGDTGWRDVTALLLNGFTATSVTCRRIGNQIRYKVEDLTAPGGQTNFLPPISGFNLPNRTNWTIYNFDAAVMQRCYRTSGNQRTGAIVPLGERMEGEYTAFTDEAWPTSLPGSAA